MTTASQASVIENLSVVRAMIKRHKRNDYLFSIIGLIALMIGLITLFTLFVDLVLDGYPRFNLEFLSNFPSRRAANAGLLSAWVGSALVMIVTFLTAVPLSVLIFIIYIPAESPERSTLVNDCADLVSKTTFPDNVTT